MKKKETTILPEQAGQEFQKIFEQYVDELFRYCAGRLADRERAMELTQECFLRAWNYQSRGGHIRHYRSFLYRILHNLIIDEYRRGTVESLEHILENGQSQALEASLLRDPGDPMQEALARFEKKDALRALRALPYPHAEILRLRYLEELSPAETGRALRTSANSASVRTHRALKKLREVFAKMEGIGTTAS